MKLIGEEFTNSDTCRGASFSSKGAPLDLAKIEISGRYPEKGWARNLESHEMVYVIDGIGSLVFEDGSVVELSKGGVVHVPEMQWFAWDGDMVIVMACSPKFNLKQYKIKEEV